MAALLPISLMAHLKGWLPRKLSFFFLFVGSAGLGAASLVRGAIGAMGLVVSVCVLVAVGVSGPRSARRFAGLAGLCFLTVMAWMTPHWVARARDVLFPIESAPQIHEGHGASHSLYLGLGAVPNRFGIQWGDPYGAAAVRAVAPDVRYTSDEYFQILWRLYLEKVRENPGEVARIYWTKAKILFNRDISLLLGWNRWRPYGYAVLLWHVLTGAVVFAAAAALLARWRASEFSRISGLALIALAFVAAFLAQAAMIHQSLQYAAPIGLFILLLAGGALELLCRSLWALLMWLLPKNPRLEPVRISTTS
jgi:hypothetical protein